MRRLAAWDRARPLVDPMCGSGTIAIEAMLWAREMAPGLGPQVRVRALGAVRAEPERHADHAARRGQGARAPGARRPTVMALDADPEVLGIARRLAKRAGVQITIDRLDVREFAAPTPPATW